jgi:hypothetical protein
MRAALVKSLVAFGIRVMKADDAWDALKDSGADPHRLGETGEVRITAEWLGGDASTRGCPHCGQSVYLSFDRDPPSHEADEREEE